MLEWIRENKLRKLSFSAPIASVSETKMWLSAHGCYENIETLWRHEGFREIRNSGSEWHMKTKISFSHQLWSFSRHVWLSFFDKIPRNYVTLSVESFSNFSFIYFMISMKFYCVLPILILCDVIFGPKRPGSLAHSL